MKEQEETNQTEKEASKKRRQKKRSKNTTEADLEARREQYSKNTTEADLEARREQYSKNITEADLEARREQYSRNTTEADREKLNQRSLCNYHKNKTDDSIARKRNEASRKAAANHAFIEEHRATFDRCKVWDTLVHEPPKRNGLYYLPATRQAGPQAGMTDFWSVDSVLNDLSTALSSQGMKSER